MEYVRQEQSNKISRPGQLRTDARLLHHYEVEKRLAAILRNARKEDRARLYSDCYEELFRSVPDHPQLTLKSANGTADIAKQILLLDPWLKPDGSFLEIGAGDCRLSIAAARRVRTVYAVDVSPSIMARSDLPANVQTCLSNGTSIPVPLCSIDIAYSNQLMEHLHPDDACEQLANIRNALKPGGHYCLVTPSRLSGPHDISRHYDPVATCFHLREYGYADIAALLAETGFTEARAIFTVRGRRIGTLPLKPVARMEKAFEPLICRMTRRLPRQITSTVLGVRVVARRGD